MSEKPHLGFSQYPTQKKSKVNKWIKIGVPVFILVVIVAVLAGVFGSRAAKKQDSNRTANSDAAASSEANAQSSIRAELGRFATATDEYFLPVYPSTVSTHLKAVLHHTSHHMDRSWQRASQGHVSLGAW
jgi:type II secretory pathway pseudopilin PulG